MKITSNNVYYSNMNAVTNFSKEAGNTRKSVLLTDYRDVVTAIDKGTLTVDGVTLELSEEVRAAIKEANDKRFKDSETVNMMNAAIHNANVAKQQGDAVEDAVIEQSRALEIARRIAKGGKVPPQDEKALMEYSPDMYQMAKQAAMMAKEHKKYTSLIKEDEEDNNNKIYDVDKGKIDTRYHVQVEVAMGDVPEVTSVSEVAVSEK